MIKRFYSLYDSVAESYGDIFVCRNDAVARRDFSNFVNNPPRGWSPEGISLVYVGAFDDETGCFLHDEPKRTLNFASDLVTGS